MSQVDRISGLVGNLGAKAPCNCATTTAITLSGAQTIDGYACTSADNGGMGTRVLVKDQANPVDNGIYYCNDSAWQRAPDFDGDRDAAQGTRIFIVSGTVNANTEYIVTTANPVNIGISSLTFTLYTAMSAVMAANIHTAGAKATPVAADEFGFWDSVSGLLKKLTWANFLAIFSASSGSSLIGFLQAGIGAIVRSLQSKERDVFSVKDFGAVGDGATNDTAAFLAAITALQASFAARRTLYIPTGQYIVNSELLFTAQTHVGVHGTTGEHNTYIQGEGPRNTTLIFTGAPAGSNGIAFQTGPYFGVEGLEIIDAKLNGIMIGKGNSGGNFSEFYYVRNVHISFSGQHGLAAFQTYIGDISNVYSYSNVGDGFNFGGFNTTIKMTRCSAALNAGNGYTLSAMVYSHIDTCSSDLNTYAGYALSCLTGVKFTACGTEGNQRDGWFLQTSTALNTGVIQPAQDIHGVVFDSCWGFQNSLALAGTYGGFIRAITANSLPMDFQILGGFTTPFAVGDRALILQGTAGAITVNQAGFVYNGFSTADSISGTVYLTQQPNTGGYLSGSPIAGIGYKTGAGAAVTQLTNKNTAVTINTPTGQITTNNASLGANAFIQFTVNNSLVAAADTVTVSLVYGMAAYGTYIITCEQTQVGAFFVGIRNMTAGALSEALVINFNLHKGAIA